MTYNPNRWWAEKNRTNGWVEINPNIDEWLEDYQLVLGFTVRQQQFSLFSYLLLYIFILLFINVATITRENSQGAGYDYE